MDETFFGGVFLVGQWQALGHVTGEAGFYGLELVVLAGGRHGPLPFDVCPISRKKRTSAPRASVVDFMYVLWNHYYH